MVSVMVGIIRMVVVVRYVVVDRIVLFLCFDSWCMWSIVLGFLMVNVFDGVCLDV